MLAWALPTAVLGFFCGGGIADGDPASEASSHLAPSPKLVESRTSKAVPVKPGVAGISIKRGHFDQLVAFGRLSRGRRAGRV